MIVWIPQPDFTAKIVKKVDFLSPPYQKCRKKPTKKF